MTRLLLVRHGSTEWNKTKRAQGTADIALTDEGRHQAAAIALRLAGEHLVAVYSSDLKRASDTADPIAKAHGLEVRTDPRLREIDQGEWTGLHVDEIKRRWPDMWGPARHYSTRPGGESPQQVRARALEAVKSIIEEHPEGTVAIVSHGGTIRWLSAEALGFDDRRSARIRGLGNGAALCLAGAVEDGTVILSNLTRMDGHTVDLDDPND